MPDNPIKLLTNMLETVERRETERQRERERKNMWTEEPLD